MKFWEENNTLRIRHLELNEGTERKSNDSFFFGTVTFFKNELNWTRNEAKFRPSRSVPTYIHIHINGGTISRH